jgi:quercetin dioxygenase-like cupin family protein
MSPTYTYLDNILDQLSDIPTDSIISRTVYSDPQVKTILFAFAAGQELSEHTSSQLASLLASLYFVQGEADLTLGDDTLTAQAGTWVQMPPHLPHSIVAKSPLLMLLTMTQPLPPEE